MIRKGFTIDTLKLVIDKSVEYDDKVFDGLYVRDVHLPSKEGGNILFAAFTFPESCRSEIQQALDELKAAKKVFEDLQTEIYYKRFGQIKRGAK